MELGHNPNVRGRNDRRTHIHGRGIQVNHQTGEKLLPVAPVLGVLGVAFGVPVDEDIAIARALGDDGTGGFFGEDGGREGFFEVLAGAGLLEGGAGSQAFDAGFGAFELGEGGFVGWVAFEVGAGGGHGLEGWAVDSSHDMRGFSWSIVFCGFFVGFLGVDSVLLFGVFFLG